MTVKFNSSINMMGSIPDYASMIEYIVEEYTGMFSEYKSFQFRTSKSLARFVKAIDDAILQFKDEKHKLLFYSSLIDTEFSLNDKLMIVFWQMLYANALFREITVEVFMKAVYQGKNSLCQEDVYYFVRHLKDESPTELQWADSTLKIIASKYLTAMKKFGLADGNQRKEICYPLIGSKLFVYFIRWCQCVNPEDRTISNSYMQFGYCEPQQMIAKLKKIEFIPYWDITQINNDVTIDLKEYE